MKIQFETIFDEFINIYNVDSIREDFEGNVHLEGNDMAVRVDQREDTKVFLCHARGLVFKDGMIKGGVEIKRGYVEEGDDIK